MCRNIRTLFNFEPPATEEEIRASAEQFVRKLSGYTHPSRANEAAFNRAIDEVAGAARRLLAALETTSPARNREVEADESARPSERAICVAGNIERVRSGNTISRAAGGRRDGQRAGQEFCRPGVRRYGEHDDGRHGLCRGKDGTVPRHGRQRRDADRRRRARIGIDGTLCRGMAQGHDLRQIPRL